METPPRHPDLEGLERKLRERPRAPVSADLRQRVLEAVKVELKATAAPPDRGSSRGTNGWWTFVAAAAATVFLWFNLSWSAACATASSLQLPAEPSSTDAVAEEIRELLPEVSRRDALCYAVTLRAGARLVRCPSTSSDRPVRHRLDALNALVSQGE